MTMASGMYGLILEGALENTAAYNFASDTFNIILVTDTYTPNFDTHSTYANVTNELATAGGYTQNTKTLGSVTSAIATGLYTFDAADTAWTSATFTARGRVVHDATVTNKLLLATTFGADYSVTAGTFTIVENAAGLLTIDYVP